MSLTPDDGSRPLRFALFGAGFWARFQLAAWREIPGVECIAIYNRTLAGAQGLAAEFGVARASDDPAQILAEPSLDFVDIVTSPASHARFTQLAADRGLAIICQKPLGVSLEEAARMVTYCERADVPLFVHENFRWQRPIRELKAVLDSGSIGRPFRARLEFSTAYPVFENQPFLRDLDQFILTDVGTHVLDVARFLFGELTELGCTIDRVHEDIAGEDVATILLRSGGGVTVVVELSFASRLEVDSFPETLVRVEGTDGSASLKPGCQMLVTTSEGTQSRDVSPPLYPWADPAYAVVHASMVPCSGNLLDGIRGGTAETTGADNLKTLGLVFGAYDLAREQAGSSAGGVLRG